MPREVKQFVLGHTAKEQQVRPGPRRVAPLCLLLGPIPVCHVASLLPSSLPLPSSISLTMWKQQSSPFPLWGPQAALPSLHFHMLTPCSGRGGFWKSLGYKEPLQWVVPRGCVGQQKALSYLYPRSRWHWPCFCKTRVGREQCGAQGYPAAMVWTTGPPEPAGIISGSLHSRAASVA